MLISGQNENGMVIAAVWDFSIRRCQELAVSPFGEVRELARYED